MRVKSNNLSVKLALCLVASLFIGVPLQAREIVPNQWHMVTLPSTAFNSESFFLSDDSIVYGVDWILFSYEPTTFSYDIVEDGAQTNLGRAYWLIQTSGGSLQLNVPSVEAVPELDCIDSNSCTTAVPIVASLWSMIGSVSPYRVASEDFEFSDGQECAQTCSLGEWLSAKPNQRIMFRYLDSELDYAVIGESAVLEPFEGYWVLDLVEDGNVSLAGLPQVPWKSDLKPLIERNDPSYIELLHPNTGSTTVDSVELYSTLHTAIQTLMFASTDEAIELANVQIANALACLPLDSQSSERVEWNLISEFGSTEQRRRLLRAQLLKSFALDEQDQLSLCDIAVGESQ